MPVYNVFHRSCIPKEDRQDVAKKLTNLHCTVTGAQSAAVKVMFIDLDSDSIFIGGERTDEYVRVSAEIRYGRTESQKIDILKGMYAILRMVVRQGEIQTQIREIDDTKTVTTNGVLNI